MYVVLSVASLTLLAILGVLARDALRRHDSAEAGRANIGDAGTTAPMV